MTLPIVRWFGPAAVWLAAVSAWAEEAPTLRRSDVVFMYDNPKLYEAYGCTVLGWSGSSERRRVEAAHAQGVRLFCSSVGFLTEWSGMIDFSPNYLDAACRNFAGEPFVVPWLWDHKYKGQPAYWWCTNSPLYREYLDRRIRSIMRSPLDGLHIDDYRGTSGAVTWLSACFCRHCMEGFRKYLAENVSKQKLASLGIQDLAQFDYRRFLLERGVKPEEYNQKRSGLPLAAEFLDFQVKANNAFVVAYRKQAEKYRGKPLALCVNSGITDPHGLVIAPYLSFFCCEVNHDAASRQVPTHPIYAYKLADGVGRPVASTAGGWDWAYIKEHKLPGLVRTWIALSYAFGHHFMAPHRQWCYTEEKGTHWYDGPTEEYAYLYQFVRRTAKLLDDYVAVERVAVVYDNAARRRGRGDIEPICAALAQRNIPFRVVVAGDDWLEGRLDAKRLLQFDAVIVASDFATSPIDEAQKQCLEHVRAAGKLVIGRDDSLLNQWAAKFVRLEGASDLLAVPRHHANNRQAPLVVHLLNRRYDGAHDAMIAAENLTLHVRRELFGGRRPARAMLHAPRSEPVALPMTAEPDGVAIRIPRLELWAIVELAE